jgi:peptidoglycan hydrolase-like protein with peptidoglycan-binding domain
MAPLTWGDAVAGEAAVRERQFGGPHDRSPGPAAGPIHRRPPEEALLDVRPVQRPRPAIAAAPPRRDLGVGVRAHVGRGRRRHARPAAAPSSTVEVVGRKRGAFGANVRAVQQALNRAGVGVKYGVDGYYGSATQASVKAFQRYKGLPVTGVVDAATAVALGFSAPAPHPAPAAATGLAVGASGPAVSQLQRLLINADQPVGGGIDGFYGVMTANAVKRFQQAKGLPATGRVDAVTMSALQAAGGSVAAPAAGSLAQGARGSKVIRLQQTLVASGIPLAGGADGIFGIATTNAVKAFQQAKGLAPSGVVDVATAGALGLASAAPTAIATNQAASPNTAGYATYGERGARVVAMQTALIAAGVALRGGADGSFGSSTLSAVLAAQRAKGIPATGKVDDATAAALGLGQRDAPAAAAAPAVALGAKPVQGPCYYGDTWQAARGVGRIHLGVDIAAKEGNALYAVATGTVTQVYSADRDALAGNGLKIARHDGTSFMYGHLSALAPGIAVGTPVTAGQLVGYVGHTGNAGVSHLHLEVRPGGGAAVNPYPIVKAIGAC